VAKVIKLDCLAVQAISCNLHGHGMWARTDQRHVTPKYIKQLWEFVQTQKTQCSSNASNSWIIRNCTLCSTRITAIYVHGAKFYYVNYFVSVPEARLHKEYRSTAIYFYYQRDHRHQWSDGDQQDHAEKFVFAEFRDSAPGFVMLTTESSGVKGSCLFELERLGIDDLPRGGAQIAPL
jgi:hypothetical protein